MTYSENQIFKYSGKWYFMTGVFLMMIIGVLVILIDQHNTMETPVLVMLAFIPVILTGIFAYISLLELNIRIDDHGMSYKVIPLFSEWRFVQKKELKSYQINQGDIKTQLKMSSKRKMRWIGRDKQFIVLGKGLVVLNLVNNRSITLSTLHPTKIDQAIAGLMNKKK